VDNKLDFKIKGPAPDALPAGESGEVVAEAFTRRTSSTSSSRRLAWQMGDFDRAAAGGNVCCESRAVLREAGEMFLKSILRKGLPGINLFSM
jgi:hypothetical protein